MELRTITGGLKMIDEKRTKQAQSNVNYYLEEGLLKRTKTPQKEIIEIFIKNSEESLMIAKDLFSNQKSNLWTIVTAYYSMHYIARAVVYKKGFLVENKIPHKVIGEALIVFVKKELKEALMEDYLKMGEEALEIAGLKSEEIIENYERDKRGRVQYSTTERAIEAKAKTSLERAKNFCFELKKLL